MQTFPKKIGGFLAGKTFLDIFETMPDIIEFVFEMWIEENCTGVFLEFCRYVKNILNTEDNLEKHEQRCIEYVRARKDKKLPAYLLKYVSLEDVIASGDD